MKEKIQAIRTKGELFSASNNDKTSEPQPLRLHAGLRLQLESMKTYLPWFIVTMTFLQTVAVIAQLALAGIAPISFSNTYSIAGWLNKLKYILSVDLGCCSLMFLYLAM